MIETKELFNCEVFYLKELFDSCRYPWEILPKIKEEIKKLILNIPEGFKLLKDGVLVGENVTISDFVTIEAPAVIGHNSVIRPGAYLRGNVITGEKCVLGNSCEYKNCILLNKVQTPHYNYVGDSVLGNGAHLGAGSICSNLKSDEKNVVIHGKKEYDTNLRKVGAFLGDGADVGSGCVLNPGVIIGKNTSVYPLTALRGVYENDLIVKSQKEFVKRK